MTLTAYPIGLHPKTDYFRCCSTTWNKETRDFILSRMKASVGNIKPIFVFLADETVQMYSPNDSLTDFDETECIGEQKIWKIKCMRKAHWMKERTRIQKDTKLTTDEKSKLIEEWE